MSKLILASASKRRIEILTRVGFTFDVTDHAFDEDNHSSSDPRAYVIESAEGKARSVRQEGIIIGADTIVLLNNEIIGKPRTREDAGKMLEKLSGKSHYVYTGIALVRGDKAVTGIEETEVHFRKLDSREIELYLEHADYMDKAGAYAIQEQASLFIDRINGDYLNVVGFPVTLFTALLEGISGKRYYEFIY